MRHLKYLLSALVATAVLLTGVPARALITIQDAASPVQYNGGGAATINGATYTVTPGASVLVVFFSTRNQGNSSNPGNPTNMKWNGNALTLGVAANTGASTYDYNVIYYMVNPPAGTGPITGTLGTGVTQTYWMAYSLAGVSTSTTLLTNSSFSTSGTTINNTIANVVTGSWAAVSGSGSANNDTPMTITDAQGGTPLTFTANPSTGATTQVLGSVSNCPAGNNQFTLTQPGANQKLAMCEAIFTAFLPAPSAPTWVSVTTQNPAAVNLSWTSSSNATSYQLKRGTNTGGPYTDFTNVLSSTTTSYQDRQVVSGTTYYYVIAAANGTGTNTSVETNATPVGTPFPPSIGAGASGPGSITVKWTPSFGTTNYILLRSTSSGAEANYITTTNTSYVDSGLTLGTTYYYKVQAAGLAGTSGLSAETSAVVLNSGWLLFDNFSLDTVNSPLNAQTGSAGLGLGWTNLGGGTPIFVTNSGTFGGYNYAQYTTNSVANIGDYESGLGIPGTSTAATVFLEFSLPGIQGIPGVQGTQGNFTGTNVVAMNFDIDNSSPPGALTGSSATGPSAQFNYDNSTGDGFFRVNSAGNFYYACISPTNTPYLPIPGDVYYFWFVLNAAKGTYQIYLANGSETGTNVDTGGLGATPTLMWGNTASNGVGSVITYSFRNVASGGSIGQPINYIGTGPGSQLGTVPQNEFANIYVDPFSQNLTNPVTGGAATGTPQVLVQPQPVEVFAGFTATFTIVGSAGVNYQWESNGVPLVDNATFSGSQTSTLTISNVTTANAANYSCVVNNPATAAFAASTPAALTVIPPSGAFESAVVTARPAHYYPFDDLGNPGTGTEIAYDYTGSDDGLYGANAGNGYDGTTGPTSGGGYTGFGAANYAVQFSDHNEPNGVTINSPWALNTNTVTITAWINPFFPFQQTNATILVNHGTGTDVEGLIYNNVGDYALGYSWNNDINNTTWDSGLFPPSGAWSFVALVITPTNAMMSLMFNDPYGMLTATHVYPHPVEPFNGPTQFGDDTVLSSIGAVGYDGALDSVAVYGQALSLSQLQNMYFAGSGMNASQFPATNSVPDISTNAYPGQTLQFTALVGGSLPLTNVWQINGVNLTDGSGPYGVISGSGTTTLTISNISSSQQGQTWSITMRSANAAGPAFVSSTATTVNVLTPNPATTIHTLVQEAAGLDWNTGTSWSDGNAASYSAFSSPGSTYQIVAGTLERSPVSTNAVFPGQYLELEGNGVLVDGNAAAFATQTTTGELRLKESGTTTFTNFGTVYTDGGSVTFPDLRLNGGQLDNGNSSIVTINGHVEVLANSAIYVDSAAAGSIRSYQINALLTGSGTLTYAYLSGTTAVNDLVVSNPSNTFTGQWNILEGALVGNGANALGTNNITIAAGAALETTYNVNDPHGVLILNGQVYLYTDDTFYGIVLNGTNVPPGTYTWAQLNSLYPASFPQTWPVQLGSTTGTNTGTGSITVLATLPPVFTQQPTSLSLYPGQTATFTAVAPNATSYHWYFTNLSNVGSALSDGGVISGSTNTVLTIAGVSSANAGTYALLATDAGGSTFSTAATLTILATGPAINITTTEIEPQNTDWNTPASWNDALAANVSVYANPGSTYEIVAGTLERSPVSTNAVFPGISLTVDGNGVLQDGALAAFTNQIVTSELRLKENGTFSTNNFGTAYTVGGVVTFPDLKLNGGQVDNGNSSSVIVEGHVEVLANSSIYIDSAAAGSIRSIEVNAFLTGSGALTFAYMTNLNYTNNDLIISGTSNTFTGQWHVEQGALLGNAANSLGTNSITVDGNGALETTYNLNSPNATLTLNGQMYLYTADTFLAASINGTAISPGTYTFAQLHTAYPFNFPSTWPVQLGSVTGTNTGSGSLHILTGPAGGLQSATISTVAISPDGTTLTLTGSGGSPSGSYHVVTSTTLDTPLSGWTPVISGSFDTSGNFSISFPTGTGDTQRFYAIKSP